MYIYKFIHLYDTYVLFLLQIFLHRLKVNELSFIKPYSA